MNRLQNIKNRIAVLENKMYILEGAEDKEKLRKHLGDDLYNAYMTIRNKIPSNADLLKQYPKYSLAELDDDRNKFNEFAKKYIKLRKSNLVTGVGETLWNNMPDTVDADDLYKSYLNYMDMRDFVIETFDKLRSFEKLKSLSVWIVQKFVDSYMSVGDLVAKAKEGADLIYSDSEWDVYKVRTYAASKYYGKGTRWCISGNYEGHEHRGEFYFNDYIKQKNLDGGYYFYLSKTDPHRKYCLLQRSDGKPLSIWNASDDELDMQYEIEDLGLPNVKGIHLPDYRIDAFINFIGNEDIESIKEFIENHDDDIDIDGLSSMGENAVVAAVETGNMQIVKMLLDAGLNPNIQSKTGYTALLVSMLDDEYGIEELLLKRGADPDARIEKYGDVRTVLYIAVMNAAQNNNARKIKSIELLLKHGADPDIASESGNKTPVFVAARYGKLNIVKMLVESGANTDIPTNSDNTPLDTAFRNGHDDVVEYLKSVGAKQINTLDD